MLFISGLWPVLNFIKCSDMSKYHNIRISTTSVLKYIFEIQSAHTRSTAQMWMTVNNVVLVPSHINLFSSITFKYFIQTSSCDIMIFVHFSSEVLYLNIEKDFNTNAIPSLHLIRSYYKTPLSKLSTKNYRSEIGFLLFRYGTLSWLNKSRQRNWNWNSVGLKLHDVYQIYNCKMSTRLKRMESNFESWK